MEDNCQLACDTCRRGSVSRRPRPRPFGRRIRPPTRIPGAFRSAATRFATQSRRRTAAQSFRATGQPQRIIRTRVRVTRPPTFFASQFARTIPSSTRLTPLQRCKQIQADPSIAAELLIRERLVFATEDTSGRRQLSAEEVVRSNIANACVPRLDEAECERSLCYNLYFRTMDGTCNNFQHPLRGAAFRPYNRLLPPEYDNGLSEPVSSLRNIRPNAREASRILLSSRKAVLHPEYNALLMQWGQYLIHDMAKTTLVPSAKCNVCQNIQGRCMSVPILPHDPNANFKSNVCIRVSRSSAICGSGVRLPRQQLNENTNFIDGSPIYGSSIHDNAKFREGRTGFLKLQNFNGMRLLPFDASKCRSSASCNAIFIAGDSRVNLFMGLTSFHIILTREHNRLAAQLQRMNPHWNGDRVFQEARKIVGGEIHAITYREYLPKILGSAFASTVGEYRGYNPNIDPTMANEFNSGAFRFGHGMIQEFYPRLDNRHQNTSFGGFNFVDGTLHSDHLIFQGGIDPVLRGMMVTPLKRPQRITTTVTENMFGNTDLGTINIQRGRDHGLPPYVRFRQLCGLSGARTMNDFAREILSPEARAKLKQVYGTPDRVDFYVGAVLEDPVVRGLIGPTLACIVGPQFQRTRDGDRFYYENPGIFTRAQLVEIRKSSLARLLCDNGDNIDFVPREAFRLGRMTPCNQIPQMDLSRWKEF
ncbi:Peroxidase mlt-7 [Toxocara canis]|uniref:peroxidase n=2 Tax=Toxocara canis TaxID=6265 RepID=A0A0B2UWF2_TOXCA|nr:Peroxidase mlt-7 [Toxocara canis]